MRFRGGPKAFYAQGRLKPGQMNKSEARYAEHLENLKSAGEILWYRFEGLKLRLADNTFYTPDFAVLSADMVLECHEVKGFWQDDARAKIKIAAEMYPFRFKAFKAEAKKRGGGYIEEDFSGIEPQDNHAPPLTKLRAAADAVHALERAAKQSKDPDKMMRVSLAVKALDAAQSAISALH